MYSFVARRLIQAGVVVVVVTVVLFFAMRLLPGDPLMIYVQEQEIQTLSPEREALLRHEFGLDKPFLLQYVDWVISVVRGEFGRSIYYSDSVGELLVERLPVTLHLGLVSFVLGNFIGFVFGLIAAVRRGTWVDSVLTSLVNLGVAAPVFLVALVLIYAFSVYLGWLPVQGYVSPLEDFWQSVRHTAMPIATLTLGHTVFVARQMRSSTLEVLRQDYIRTAWAKGLDGRLVIIRHVLKNALIPPVTGMGIGLANTVGGSVILENVFNIPGIGRLLVKAVMGRDYQVVQTMVLMLCLLVTVINLIVDMVNGWLDPKIRYD